MKILIISESINVEDSSASKGRVALINNLKKAGYEILVLHFSHKEIFLNGIETHLIKENKKTILFYLSRLIRIIQRLFKININKKVEKFIGFSFTHTNDKNAIAKAIKKSDINFDPNFILTLSKGGSFRPHRAMLDLEYLSQKWIAYIHDPYPYHFYPRPYNFVEESYMFKEKMMKNITDKARYLAFPSLLLKDWMNSYFPIVESKSVIIPHQINVETTPEKLPSFFTPNEFSLLHAGNLLKQREPKYLIQAYLNFLDNNEKAKQNSKLYFIGDYKKHKTTLDVYKNHPNIIVHDYIEYRIIQELEKQSAVNIILEAISEISPFLPGKFPNCIKVNKPILVLGPYYSETRRLLGNQYKFWSETNDVNKIEILINQLYENWNTNKSEFDLNRDDLIDYCNEVQLKKTIDSLAI